MGGAAAVAVKKALLGLWQQCANAGSAERVAEAAGPLLRMQLLAGTALDTGAVADLKEYLREVAGLAAQDRTFLASRRIEADLLQILTPGDPLAVLRFGIETIQKVEEWLALRFAWGEFFRFRRWRRRAARAWGDWADRAEERRQSAQDAGDPWEEEDRRHELSYTGRVPGALVFSSAEDSLRRWRCTLTSPLVLSLLLAGPELTLALLGRPVAAIHPLALAAAALWVAAAIGLVHRFLSQLPTVLWGGGAGSLIASFASLAGKDKPTVFSGAQLALWVGTAMLTTAILVTRLPATDSVPVRLGRAGLLLVFVTVFQLGIMLFLVSAWASLQPAWFEAVAAVQVPLQGATLRIPVSWVLGIALGSISGSIGGLAVNLKYPGPLVL
jgi:hypothetical protein